MATAFVWTTLIWFTQALLAKLGVKLGKGMGMMIIYLISNFVSLWLISRLGPAIGFGSIGFMWTFGLAFVASFVQFLGWVVMAKFKLAEM